MPKTNYLKTSSRKQKWRSLIKRTRWARVRRNVIICARTRKSYDT